MSNNYTYVEWLNIAELIKSGNTVWCRDGGVCQESNLCCDYSCGYKLTKEDVLNGIKKCGMFTITEGPNKNWYTARHLLLSDREYFR